MHCWPPKYFFPWVDKISEVFEACQELPVVDFVHMCALHPELRPLLFQILMFHSLHMEQRFGDLAKAASKDKGGALRFHRALLETRRIRLPG